jgi:hypothetical protein
MRRNAVHHLLDGEEIGDIFSRFFLFSFYHSLISAIKIESVQFFLLLNLPC